jgi:hypothetical protein
MPEHDESYFRCDACTIQKMKNISSNVLSSMAFLQPMKPDKRCLQRKRIATLSFRNPVGSDGEIL